MQILNSFSIATGQRINTHKSGLIKVTGAIKHQMSQILNIQAWEQQEYPLAQVGDPNSKQEMWGLGFKEFYHMNSTLLAKQAWRIHQQPNSLWVKLFKAVYFPNQDFL